MWYYDNVCKYNNYQFLRPWNLFESDIQVTESDSLAFWRECSEVNTSSPGNVSRCVIMLGFVRRSSAENRGAQQTIAGTSNKIHAITANCRTRGLPLLVPNTDYWKVITAAPSFLVDRFQRTKNLILRSTVI